MKRKTLVVFGLLIVTLFLLTVSIGAAMPDEGKNTAGDGRAPQVDDRMDPLTLQQRENHVKAMEAKANGKTAAYGNTYAVAKGQYVELEREGEDPVWTVIGEFGDLGHNSIVRPDRSVNNTTYWVEDFNRDHYMDLLFSEGKDVTSMRQWYIEQSSNRYAVYGDVTDWQLAPKEACKYDDDVNYPSDPLDPDFDPYFADGGSGVWYFIRDTVNDWYDEQKAADMSDDEINAYLAQFDVWDRYDWDGDGNFDEPDGYIDHMNFVHAGEGNEALEDENDCAIWSHSWFAFYNKIGAEGPSPEFLIGGLQIGGSDFWLNKYVINPENGGVGVFAHEFGHDLGLPDLYDYTGENGTGFWTMMSSGSWLSQSDEYIGTEPGHFGAWEKFQLGWLKYKVASGGGGWASVKLGPAETNTKRAQGLFVLLPDKQVTEQIADPYAGDYFYYSGSGNDLDNWMTKEFTLDPGSSLTAQANVQIEIDWDYAYLVVSTDGGATWENVDTNLSSYTDPNGQNFGNGITGNSGGWVELTADLSTYTGDVMLGFRYWTDVAAIEPGFMVDNIEISGYPVDGAEADAGWDFDGFWVTTGEESGYYFNAYVAEFRQYRGFDKGLANAYNFGWGGVPGLGDWVEHFPYQDGLLISYWDTSFGNNDVGAHCAAGRCGGLLLPVDAHPKPLVRPDGGIWRNRVQSYDATFGLEPTDALTLHWEGEESEIPSLPAAKQFNDSRDYWRDTNPEGSVQVPNTGTTIRVKSVSARGSFMQIQVRPTK